jgi:molybdate transport system substrate-binding protein
MTSPRLSLLCAGAAQGIVRQLGPEFEREARVRIEARYGAVGAMKEALLAGAPCDAMILTAAMIDELVRAQRLCGPGRALGRVATGIAVRSGEPRPDVSSADALRRARLAATQIHFPDPARATAGIHFASVLQRLGIASQVEARLCAQPNGAAAMRALATSGAAGAIGCTQVSEILYTDGVALVAPLPPGCELLTVYAAAVATHAAVAPAAEQFVALLSGDATRPIRIAAGFEPIP